jgi:hypothetical protein
MKIIERIFEYIKYKGVTVADFERKNSLSNGYLRKMKQRNADIGETIIVNILENCPDISLSWFVLGEGSMLKTETPLEDTSNDVLTPENGVLNTLKGIIKEQALEIARLELEVEKLKNTSENG